MAEHKEISSRSIWGIRLEAIWRLALMGMPASTLGRKLLVTEYPKSGGTWLGQMLADSAGIAFPRHEWPPLSPCIMHGHYVRDFRNPATIVLWRDPRDLTVSWYHHCLFHDKTNAAMVDRVKNDLKFANVGDVRGNLPRFIDYMFTRQRTPGFSWNAFYDKWAKREDIVHVSYEALRSAPAVELARVCAELRIPIRLEKAEHIAERYSFERMAGRKPGEERRESFLRKGIVGDWKTQFSAEAAQVFAQHVGYRIVDAGYAKSLDWYQRAVGRQ